MSEQRPTIPIFDGHNDTVLSLRQTGRSFFERTEIGHVDLPRARAGGMVGGFFAVWVPDPCHEPQLGTRPNPDVSAYTDVATMPPPMATPYAQHQALGLLACLIRLEETSGGAVQIVTTARQLRECVTNGTFAIELHLEGAEPIDPDLDALEVYARAGVRSVGICWSRSNAFGHGVPFKFGATPDTGPGLTDAGKALVRACNRLGIIVDVSHLNEAGFWDVAALTEDPIVATHSCAYALSPSTRNLTDKQLDAIRDSEGIVGVNFHVGFVRRDGKSDVTGTTVTAIADHVDYLIDRLGVDQVAFGSDFDGAVMPSDLPDAASLPNLIAELRRRGYDDATLRKLGYENWLRVCERTWTK